MQRDLACRDPWTESLERSHARRLRDGAAPPFARADELLPEVPRDLTDPEVLQRSVWRSHARRAAAAQSFEMPRPSPRGLSLAALFAVVGVPAVGVGSGLGGSTDTAEAATTVLKKGDRGGRVASLQRKLGIGADGIYRPRHQARSEALSGAPRPHRRRHRRPADPPQPRRGPDATGDAPHGLRPGRDPRAPARARPPRRRCLRPPDQARGTPLPGASRPRRRRRRRPADTARPRRRLRQRPNSHRCARHRAAVA